MFRSIWTVIALLAVLAAPALSRPLKCRVRYYLMTENETRAVGEVICGDPMAVHVEVPLDGSEAAHRSHFSVPAWFGKTGVARMNQALQRTEPTLDWLVSTRRAALWKTEDLAAPPGEPLVVEMLNFVTLPVTVAGLPDESSKTYDCPFPVGFRLAFTPEANDSRTKDLMFQCRAQVHYLDYSENQAPQLALDLHQERFTFGADYGFYSYVGFGLAPILALPDSQLGPELRSMKENFPLADVLMILVTLEPSADPPHPTAP